MSTPAAHRTTPAILGQARPPQVAVIVPCYNVASCLARALNSVFAQTYTDLRVYAVDDGSADGTLKALESYGMRCCIASQPHAGAAAARNRAIRMSDAPYIAFLDADDEWLPRKLERQIALMEQDNELGLVCSLCAVRGPQDHTYPLFKLPDATGPGKLFAQLASDCFVTTPTVLVRRRCLEDVGLFQESLVVSEDFNLWLRIAARWRIALLPEVLAITHKREGSLSVNISPRKRLQSGVVALQDVQSRCPDLSLAETYALRRALAQRRYFYGSWLLSADEKFSARRELLSALQLHPGHVKAAAKLLLSSLPGGTFKLLSSIKARLGYRSRPVLRPLATTSLSHHTKELRITR
jgi:glycosyltransferase involved in cell wall biosynthesis